MAVRKMLRHVYILEISSEIYCFVCMCGEDCSNLIITEHEQHNSSFQQKNKIKA